jgi:hypothetical protein
MASLEVEIDFLFFAICQCCLQASPPIHDPSCYPEVLNASDAYAIHKRVRISDLLTRVLSARSVPTRDAFIQVLYSDSNASPRIPSYNMASSGFSHGSRETSISVQTADGRA